MFVSRVIEIIVVKKKYILALLVTSFLLRNLSEASFSMNSIVQRDHAKKGKKKERGKRRINKK